MPIYMAIGPAGKDGSLDISKMLKGKSTEKNHIQWIKLDSCDVDGNSTGRAGGPANTGSGRSGNSTSSMGIKELNCTRDVDGLSATLFQMTTGKFPWVGSTLAIVDFAKVDRGEEVVYLHLELKNVLISSYRVSNAQRSPTEIFTLNFVKIAISAPADPPKDDPERSY